MDKKIFNQVCMEYKMFQNKSCKIYENLGLQQTSV